MLLITMNGNRLFCTNHNNVECDLEDCFRIRPTKRPMLFTYKTFDVKAISMHLVNPEVYFQVVDEIIAFNGKDTVPIMNTKIPHGTRGYACYTLVRGIPFEIQIASRKRLDNNTLLGLEVTFVMDKLHICFKQKVWTEFLHWVMGVSYALWRTEAVKEIYGPDPHGEKENLQNFDPATLVRQQTRSPQESIANKITMQATNINRGRLTRDFFREDERAQISALEAEIEASAANNLSDSDWQRSSLNSDEDPTHLRLAIVLQANEIKFQFPLDDIKRPPFPSSFSASPEWEGEDSGGIGNGIVISIKSVVHSCLWPEHAGLTEGVLQTIIHDISVSEYKGLKSNYILRICTPLDVNGKQIDVGLLPRGVKEINYFDPESLPGAAFVYKKESSWPPPPLNGRIGATAEFQVSDVELTCDLDAWGIFVSFCIGAWDNRWIADDPNWKGLPAGTWTECVVGSGTFETTLNCRGIRAILYPAQVTSSSKNTHEKETSKGPILPSEIVFSCDDFQLIKRADLKMSFLETLFEGLENGMETFPSCATDLLSMIRREFGSETTKNPNALAFKNKQRLMSTRTHISFSNVRLEVSTDYFSSKNAGNMNSNEVDYGQYTPPRKALVRPFSITYYNSIDPNPSIQQVFPPKATMQDPYSRPYYCPWNNTSIETSFIGVKDLTVECSMLDIIRIIHTFDVLSARFLQSDVVAWLYPRRQQSDGTITSVVLNQPARTFVSKVINCEVKIVESAQSELSAAASKPSLSSPKEYVKEGAPLIALHTRNLQVSFEQPATNDESEYIPMDNRPEPVVVVKAVVCGVAATVCGVPVLLLTSSGGNSSTTNPTQIATQLTLKGDSLLKFLDGPTATIRYEFRPGQTHSIFKRTPPPSKFSSTPSTTTSSAKAENLENKQVVVTVKSVPDIGVLRVELTRGSRLLTVPKLIEIAAQRIAMEMLRGFGSVRSQPITWWEDSVYGYIIKRFGFEKSSTISNFAKDTVSLKESSLTEQEKARISSLAFRLTAKHAFDIVILEADQFGGIMAFDQSEDARKLTIANKNSHFSKYLVVSFIALDVNGKSLPGPPRSANMKVSGTMQLVLLKEEVGRIGQSTVSRDICNPFTLITEITKTGEEAFHVKTNVSLTEIALDLPREMASDAMSIMDHAISAMQGVSRVMVKFRSIVVDCCPSLSNQEEHVDGEAKESSQEAATRVIEDRKMALAVSLDIARMMTTTATSNSSSDVSWFRDAGDVILDVDWKNRSKQDQDNAVDDTDAKIGLTDRRAIENEQLQAQKLLIEKLQDNLATGYKLLKESMSSVNDDSQHLSTSLSSIQDICRELSELLEKVRSAAVITASQIPEYCGWLRRSSDFSRIDPGISVRKFNKSAAGSMKWWCSLIGRKLYFMPRPYNSAAEVEILLDDVAVIDPDVEKISGKTVLTTCIWLVDGEGALVLNLDSLDEKHSWLKALRKWVTNDPNLTSKGYKPRKIDLSTPSSLSSASPSSASNAGLVSKSLNAVGINTNSMSDQLGQVGAVNAQAISKAKKGASKLLSSATKGVMNVFGKRKSDNSAGNGVHGGDPGNRLSNGEEVINGKRTSIDSSPDADKMENLASPTPLLDEVVEIQRQSIPMNSLHRPSVNFDPCVYASSMSELIDELDSLREPLTNTLNRVSVIRKDAEQAAVASTGLLTNAQESIGKAAIGLAAVKVLYEELHAEKVIIEDRCESAVFAARAECHVEKLNAVSLREKWSRAKFLQEQLERVLEYSADESNAQIKIMTKKYNDLSSQYEKLRNVQESSWTGSSAATNPKDYQELVRQLTVSIGDHERTLKEANEREMMASEDKLSISSDWAYSKKEVRLISEKMNGMQIDKDRRYERLERELKRERAARLEAKKETKLYKERLTSMFKALEVLGLDIGQKIDVRNVDGAISLEEKMKLPQQKSLVMLKVHPLNDQVDLEMVWNEIKDNLIIRGVVWGDKYKLQTDGYGFKVLFMTCTIIDSLAVADDVTDAMESLDEFIMSVEVLSSKRLE